MTRAWATAVAGGPLRRDGIPAAGIVVLALLAGLAMGDPAPHWALPLACVAGVGVAYSAFRWPYASVLVLVGSTILLPAFLVTRTRAATPFDVLLMPALIASAFGIARRDARLQIQSGEAHDRLRLAERRFTHAVLWFYGLALLSLLRTAQLVGVSSAADSGLMLLRAMQGLAIYPLCTWWLRSRERVEQAWTSLFVAGSILTVVNVLAVSAWGVSRAGMTWYVNDPLEPIASPNEAGVTTLLLGVVLMVRHAVRPQARHFGVGLLVLVMLVLTQSRSGLLAWGTFGLLTLRWVKPSRLLAGALSAALMLPLVPQAFWARMTKTVFLERGTFEAFTWFQRVYGWMNAWRVFVDQPLIGVGYLGYRFVSHQNNPMNIAFWTVENYYFEMLVSMGVVGLAVLAVVFVQLFRLGREVGRTAPRDTLAWHMARFHAPLMVALMVANLTGDNFVGMVGVAQIAMWTAILVRAGHAAIAGTGSPAGA